MARPTKIKQRPLADRPREKLHHKGVTALSDFELLEVLIGSGNHNADAATIARHIQKQLRRSGTDISYEQLTAIKGVSIATAGKILAALELASRYLIKDSPPLITTAQLAAEFHDIRTKQQEYLLALSLDGAMRVIAQRTITVGTLDTLAAHPREVFADALADRAACVVIAHNHPSGDSEPSDKDIALTQALAAAGQLVGVPLHEHLILTKTGTFSFKKHGLL